MVRRGATTGVTSRMTPLMVIGLPGVVGIFFGASPAFGAAWIGSALIVPPMVPPEYTPPLLLPQPQLPHAAVSHPQPLSLWHRAFRRANRPGLLDSHPHPQDGAGAQQVGAGAQLGARWTTGAAQA